MNDLLRKEKIMEALFEQDKLTDETENFIWEGLSSEQAYNIVLLELEDAEGKTAAQIESRNFIQRWGKVIIGMGTLTLALVAGFKSAKPGMISAMKPNVIQKYTSLKITGLVVKLAHVFGISTVAGTKASWVAGKALISGTAALVLMKMINSMTFYYTNQCKAKYREGQERTKCMHDAYGILIAKFKEAHSNCKRTDNPAKCEKKFEKIINYYERKQTQYGA